MSRHSIPGLSPSFQIVYMQQEIPSMHVPVWQFISKQFEFEDVNGMDSPAQYRAQLKDEESLLEAELDRFVQQETSNGSQVQIEELSDRLCEIAEELELLDLDEASTDTSKATGSSCNHIKAIARPSDSWTWIKSLVSI